MKYEKLINESKSLIDSIIRQQRKREKKIAHYLEQIQLEEKSLRKQMKKQTNKVQRKKLAKKLTVVKQAYSKYGT